MTDCEKYGCESLVTQCCKCGRKANSLIMPPQTGWISVKDRLPPENLWIIGGNYKRVEMGVWMGEKKGFVISSCNYLCLEITHWMPLPEPPK
jgi:hypothetical protein